MVLTGKKIWAKGKFSKLSYAITASYERKETFYFWATACQTISIWKINWNWHWKSLEGNQTLIKYAPNGVVPKIKLLFSKLLILSHRLEFLINSHHCGANDDGPDSKKLFTEHYESSMSIKYENVVFPGQSPRTENVGANEIMVSKANDGKQKRATKCLTYSRISICCLGC